MTSSTITLTAPTEAESATANKLVSVVVPSYKRPENLARCLHALSNQSYPHIEVLIVSRVDDEETRTCASGFTQSDHRFKIIDVDQPGVVHALNTGLRAAQGDYVSFTDDDAEAPSHWIQAIIDHFDQHPECGGVGGQDRLQLSKESLRNPPTASKIGSFSRSGKFYGNHHCPITEPYLMVDILKGVNMSFRSNLLDGLEIGQGLRGSGAQVGWEHSLAHCIKSQNMELHFIKEAWLLHHVAERKDNDNRLEALSQFALDTTYNSAYVVSRFQNGWVASAVTGRSLLIGNRLIPGLIRCLSNPVRLKIFARHLPHLLAGLHKGFCSRMISRSFAKRIRYA